jgi:hypothetical protein
MIPIDPFAYYDALAVTARLSRVLGAIAISEVHLFSYLACLLSLYRGWPVADWNYRFAATENGSPYSAAIEDAVHCLVREGFLDLSNSRFVSINNDGHVEHAELAQLSRNKERDEFLDGSCSSALAIPIGVIRSTVTTDHDMRLASRLGKTRELLSDPAVDGLHSAFSALSSQIGIDVRDLMVPAVLWLCYVAEAEAQKAVGIFGVES